MRPYLPEGATDIGFGNFVQWPQRVGADNYRRGLCIFRQCTLPYPQLETFDAPDAVQVACKRDRSTTPLQALTLLNDPVFAEAARELARRAAREAGPDSADRARLMFRLCLSREPGDRELARLLAYRDQQLRLAAEASAVGAERDPGAASKEAFSWTAVASVLLNLAEFLTRA